MTRAAVQVPIESELHSLGSATGWLNSPPLDAVDLRGKVVLIDFWTYSCIDWIRSLGHPLGSACASMDSRRARLTESTSTSRGLGRRTNSGCIS